MEHDTNLVVLITDKVFMVLLGQTPDNGRSDTHIYRHIHIRLTPT